jgi:eukaryotic-like serine/threonine-protein kinase
MSEDSEIRARSKARLGTVLRGKYFLDRVLGMGGMAVVYAATHRNRKQFAVKMLHAELSHRDDVRMRFLREGYAANSLKHRGAVAVIDDDVAEDGSAFLVMELLEGDVLETLWHNSDRHLPARAVLAIGHQLLDVLAAAHDEGVVHRDIKPANLFLTEEGTLKVLDFGIARVRDAVATGVQTTGTGVVLGSPAFMAPEQALGESSEIDGQTDIWAAGATLFALLSGRSVHEGENAAQLIVKAATTRPRSLASVAPEAPPIVVEIIDRALAFGKASRWPSAAVFRDAIRDAYADLYGEPISHGPLLDLTREHGRAAHPPTPETDPQAPSVGTTPSALARSPTIPLPPLEVIRSAPEAPVAVHTSGLTGMLTSNPVSSDSIDVLQGVPRRKPATLWMVAAGAAAAISLGAALELGGPWSRQPQFSLSTASAASAPSAAPPSAVVPPSATAPSTTPPAQESLVAPVLAPATATAIAPRSGAPSPARIPTRGATRSTVSAPSSASADPHIAKPAAPCAVVTTVDDRGNPHFSCPCATCE